MQRKDSLFANQAGQMPTSSTTTCSAQDSAELPAWLERIYKYMDDKGVVDFLERNLGPCIDALLVLYANEANETSAHPVAERSEFDLVAFLLNRASAAFLVLPSTTALGLAVLGTFQIPIPLDVNRLYVSIIVALIVNLVTGPAANQAIQRLQSPFLRQRQTRRPTLSQYLALNAISVALCANLVDTVYRSVCSPSRLCRVLASKGIIHVAFVLVQLAISVYCIITAEEVSRLTKALHNSHSMIADHANAIRRSHTTIADLEENLRLSQTTNQALQKSLRKRSRTIQIQTLALEHAEHNHAATVHRLRHKESNLKLTTEKLQIHQTKFARAETDAQNLSSLVASQDITITYLLKTLHRTETQLQTITTTLEEKESHLKLKCLAINAANANARAIQTLQDKNARLSEAVWLYASRANTAWLAHDILKEDLELSELDVWEQKRFWAKQTRELEISRKRNAGLKRENASLGVACKKRDGEIAELKETMRVSHRELEVCARELEGLVGVCVGEVKAAHERRVAESEREAFVEVKVGEGGDVDVEDGRVEEGLVEEDGFEGVVREDEEEGEFDEVATDEASEQFELVNEDNEKEE